MQNDGMRVWLRAHTRVAAIVALLAMALQIIGPFGHVHGPKPSRMTTFAQSDMAAKASLLQAGAAADHGAAISESDQLPAGADGDALCPLCLLGHLVASAVPVSVPALVAPVAYGVMTRSLSAIAPAAADIPTSFWSRGPPTS